MTVITSIIMVYGENIGFTVTCQDLFLASTGVFFFLDQEGLNHPSETSFAI